MKAAKIMWHLDRPPREIRWMLAPCYFWSNSLFVFYFYAILSQRIKHCSKSDMISAWNQNLLFIEYWICKLTCSSFIMKFSRKLFYFRSIKKIRPFKVWERYLGESLICKDESWSIKVFLFTTAAQQIV